MSAAQVTTIYVAPDNTCGYYGGSPALPVNCLPSVPCVFFAASNGSTGAACCPRGPLNCFPDEACLDREEAQASGYCDDAGPLCREPSRILICADPETPYCVARVLRDSITATWWLCEATSSPRTWELKTTYIGQQGRQFQTLTVTASSLPLSDSTRAPESTTTASYKAPKQSISSSPSASDQTANAIVTMPADPPGDPSQRRLPTGYLTGGIVGGVIGIIVIAAALFFIMHRRRKARQFGRVQSSGLLKDSSTLVQVPHSLAQAHHVTSIPGAHIPLGVSQQSYPLGFGPIPQVHEVDATRNGEQHHSELHSNPVYELGTGFAHD